MQDHLNSIISELLFITGTGNARLTDLLLDLRAVDIRQERSVRVIVQLLKIRKEVISLHYPLAQELTLWAQQNISVVTFCPFCGTKRDSIPLEIHTNNIRDIVNDSHHYFCQIIKPYYPYETHVYYAFSYVDERESPVETEDLLWYEAGIQASI